jgi:hypothetical protein
MPPVPPFFVVSFEHSRRAFKCVRLEWSPSPAEAVRAQWIVTIAGRPVWSFDATGEDSPDGVQRAVVQWWDAGGGPL